MAMTTEQWAFLQDVGKLIAFAAEKGYTLTPGEMLRTPAQAWLNSLPAKCTLTAMTEDGKEMHYYDQVGGRGIAKSKHIQGLAVDYNLIIDGKLAQNVSDYQELGEFWESLSPLNRWGGKFVTPRPDAPHFERNVV